MAADAFPVVDDVLARYARRAQVAVLETIPVSGPRRDLYDLLAAHLVPGGKGLRPAIVMATCGALGGDPERALPFAAAIELLHSAFLVHDDIQDASPRRRGKLTLHEIYGVPLALNAGDALATLAARVMSRAVRGYGVHGATASDEFLDVIQCAIEGQAMELGFRNRLAEASDADYVEIVARKTAAYTTILPLRLGALVAEGAMPARGRFERFGFLLGALFQLRDDVRNLWPDDPGDSGAGSDIVEGKPTPMVIHALRTASAADSAALTVTLRTPNPDAAAVKAAIAIIERSGGREFGQGCARLLADAATAAASDAFGASAKTTDGAFLTALPQYLLSR